MLLVGHRSNARCATNRGSNETSDDGSRSKHHVLCRVFARWHKSELNACNREESRCSTVDSICERERGKGRKGEGGAHISMCSFENNSKW